MAARAIPFIPLSFFLALTLLLGCTDDEPTASDTTAPAGVADLAIVATTGTEVTLVWSAPGDDGMEGTATSYDVRYRDAAFDESAWDSLLQVADEPAPRVAGSPESLTVAGLQPGTTYYFALRAADEEGNESALSNVVSATTGAPVGGWIVAADGSGDFASIATAVAAVADGDTLRIAAGEYVELLDLTGRSLVLIGAGPAATLVRSQATPGDDPLLTIGPGAEIALQNLRIKQGDIQCGAGLLCEQASVTFEDCALIWTGLEAIAADVSFTRCTIWGLPRMLCDMIVPLVRFQEGNGSFSHCIVGTTVSTLKLACAERTSVTFDCSDFWNIEFVSSTCPSPVGSNGNIARDPRFVDPDQDDDNFYLQSDSPCLEGAVPGCGRMGALGEE